MPKLAHLIFKNRTLQERDIVTFVNDIDEEIKGWYTPKQLKTHHGNLLQLISNKAIGQIVKIYELEKNFPESGVGTCRVQYCELKFDDITLRKFPLSLLQKIRTPTKKIDIKTDTILNDMRDEII